MAARHPLPRQPLPRMSADEFIAWAMERPEHEHYELVAGEVVGMSPERIGHARFKGTIFRALHAAILEAGLPCEALPDGMVVCIDESTIYEPDALVRCGEPVSDDTVELRDPVIVVEVVSPSSRSRDGAKLDDYFRLPSVRHYLIAKTDNRTIIHHRKTGDGKIETTILRTGELRLDPPGLTLRLEALFPG